MGRIRLKTPKIVNQKYKLHTSNNIDSAGTSLLSAQNKHP
jgi:hypothetical protein